MDDQIRLTLEVAFCCYSYDFVAKKFLAEGYPSECNPLDREYFVRHAADRSALFNSDQLELLYTMFETTWLCPCRSEFPIWERPRNIFHSLLHFTENVLRHENQRVLVRFGQLLRWRELSCVVGEDLLVCAFLAAKDAEIGYKRTDFVGPAVCRCDDLDLKDLAANGYADLHFHLKGSSDNFEITWLSLMNHIRRRAKDFKTMERCLSAGCAVSEFGAHFSSAHKMCVEAARIRLYLFRLLKGDPIPEDFLFPLCDSDDVGFVGETEDLQREINITKDLYKIGNEQYDYAFDFFEEGPYILQVLSGERRLIYSVLKRIYGAPTDRKLTYWLYRYLLAKAQIREKFVQVNKQMGFSNFMHFEKRKDIFLEKHPKYRNLIAQIAILGSAYRNNVRYIEARIAPKKQAIETARVIAEIDRNVRRVGRDIAHMPDYNFILHFIKEDDRSVDPDESMLLERHHALRLKIRRQIQGVVALRRQSPSFAARIVALDAANSELNCRPEVFSQAYRYSQNSAFASPTWLPDLKYTFHVGEVFCDVVDGLRAIDEAVLFLQLRPGDRLGHCLALGVDPDICYGEHRTIMISEQCLLDNVVWLKYTADKYGVELPNIVEGFLLDTFERLYARIYDAAENEKVTMRDYYLSMKLRGDDPFSVGKRGGQPSPALGDWSSSALCNEEECCRARMNTNAASLYRQYHFNCEVRLRGKVVTRVVFSKEYVEVVRRLQDKMIDWLTEKQLVVECCPTSNYRIGAFSRYDNHPITRFFDVGLTDSSTHQLPVTINTDDQAIFSTSMDNEFAVIVSALSKKGCYSHYQIMRWIEEVRNNSWKYRFSHKNGTLDSCMRKKW